MNTDTPRTEAKLCPEGAFFECVDADFARELERETAGWQPIETAPKDETPIDIYSKRQGRLPNYRRVEKSPTNVFYDPCYAGICCIRDASHWMPFPKPPIA